MSDHRLINDDYADNSGKINIEAKELIPEFSKHPHAHVALAIMCSGAIPLQDDNDDDPVGELLSGPFRRMSDRIQANNKSNTARQEKQPSSHDCRDWKWTGEEFEEHYT